MKLLRSLLFNLAFYGWTLIMCTLMLGTLPLPHRYFLNIVRFWLWHVVWIERHIGKIDYRVIGAENVPAGTCIIAAKHQSAWETFKLHTLFGDPSIVLKKELLNLPIWGWYLRRSGMIPIDRKGGSSTLSAMVAAAKIAANNGRKIVIFPQGTRVRPDEDRPYKSGVASLYQELGLPVVPMALNSGLLWPRNSFIKKSGLITIEFLPPIMPGLKRDAFMTRLKTELEAASLRLSSSP